jgi:glutathione synthase
MQRLDSIVGYHAEQAHQVRKMHPAMRSSYPPSVHDGSQRERLVQAIKDWSMANGLAVLPPPDMAPADTEGILAMPAPVTLFPSPFPKTCFDEAKSVQTTYNELYASLSQDDAFLAGIVKE